MLRFPGYNEDHEMGGAGVGGGSRPQTCVRAQEQNPETLFTAEIFIMDQIKRKRISEFQIPAAETLEEKVGGRVQRVGP